MSQNQRVPYDQAVDCVTNLIETINIKAALGYGVDFRVCGSVRRHRPDCGDIDVAVTSEQFNQKQDQLRGLLDSFEDTQKGRLHHGYFQSMKVEFYVGPAAGLGALVLFATGSPGFNVKCRQIAKQRGWALNQYGLWQGSTDSGKMVCDCATEESILAALGLMQYSDPASREVAGGWH